MQRIISIFLFLLSVTIATAQQLTPIVIASAGNHASSQGYHLSWTLGEVVIATNIQADATLLQGFQQPNYLFDVLVREPENGYQIKLFPNPASRWITIEINGPENPLTAELFDLFGRLILRKTLDQPRTGLDLSRLPSTTYLLRISDEKNESVGLWRVQKMW